MTPHERLTAARIAAREGRHEEALREYLWFHEYALEEEPAVYGVRLSFALGYWIDLGKQYPEALHALEAVRDQKTDALLRGTGHRGLFHDVASINDVLGVTSRTHALFARLAVLAPELARTCASIALPAVVEAGDFALAAQFLPEPETHVRALTVSFHDDLAHIEVLPPSRAPRRQVTIEIYAAKLRLVLAILTGTGLKAEAARIEELALELIQPSDARHEVRAAL